MKLKELLSVVSDNLGDVVVELDPSLMSRGGLSAREIMAHLEYEVFQVYVYRNKLRILLDNPVKKEEDEWNETV